MWKSGHAPVAGALSVTCNPAEPSRPQPVGLRPGRPCFVRPRATRSSGSPAHSAPDSKSHGASTSSPVVRSWTRISSRSTVPADCPKRKCIVAACGSSCVGTNSKLISAPAGVSSQRLGPRYAEEHPRPHRLAVHHQSRRPDEASTRTVSIAPAMELQTSPRINAQQQVVFVMAILRKPLAWTYHRTGLSGQMHRAEVPGNHRL